MSTIDLSNKTALVTGASRGIGRAIAKTLAAAGAMVIVMARNEGLLKQLVIEIEADGGKAALMTCDVSHTESVKESIKTILEEHHQIDILINNAGVTRDTLILRMKEDDWDHVINTNLRSVFTVSKLAARHMLKRRYGSIINITSVVGLRGNAGQANYAASKAGIIGFTKSIAKEFGSRNVRCNSVAPGFIDTDMTSSLQDQYKEDIIKGIPLGKMGSAENVADTVLFLASDLSSYITGQVIVVDGGMGN